LARFWQTQTKPEVIAMKKNEIHVRSTRRRILIGIGGTLVTLVWLLATPALAHPGHHHKHKHKNRHAHGQVLHRHHQRVVVKRPVYTVRELPPPSRRVVVPTVIRRGRVETYRTYYGGRIYYGPHRHHHEVYYFPVFRDRRYVYEPHYYCDGHRVRTTRVTYHGPHISFGIGF
jgi:hypothetical protein